MKPILGCIATDFAGASDAASFLTAGGMHTVLYNGLPADKKNLEKCDAIVIALNTRSLAKEDVVEKSLKAAKWLKKQGIKQLYIKYCLTVDSIPEGNIGSILDAMVDKLGCEYTVLCPGLPGNGKIVKNGILYVNEETLNENLIWSADIAKLMQPQSKYPCWKMSAEEMVKGIESIKTFAENTGPFYIIPDHEKEEDTIEFVKAFGGLPLLSGGSGILFELAKKHMKDAGHTTKYHSYHSETEGKALILAGSCAKITKAQIDYYKNSGGRSIFINPEDLTTGNQTVEAILKQVENETIIYSSQDPEENGAEDELIESTMATIAKKVVEAGYTRIIVTGDKISGVVMQALESKGFIIAENVDPGVPVMIPMGNKELRLILKSENFGAENFFEKMLTTTDVEQVKASCKHLQEYVENFRKSVEKNIKLDDIFDEVIWIAKSLFDRGKVVGSAANLSFKYEDTIYITGSDACFGKLTRKSFAEVTMEGVVRSMLEPSKEFPMHQILYKHKDVAAVIHTHSLYATLWSCLNHENKVDCIPSYTPYLKMKVGTVGIVPYAVPGSAELFSLIEANVAASDGFLLSNHGVLVAGENMMDAFYKIEEIEESARIAWELRDKNISRI